MDSVINDLDALKKLRYQLEDVVEDLKNQSKKTQSSLDNVSHTWKDSQFKKFQSEFSTDMDEMRPLYEKIEAFDNEYLLQLQKALERYLQL